MSHFSLGSEDDPVETEDDEGTKMPLALCSKAGDTRVTPKIFYEVKQNVSGIDFQQYKELFLQAYYSLPQYDLQHCVYCLTDAMSYQYFRVVQKEDRLDLAWQRTLSFNPAGGLTSDNVSQHLSFLEGLLS